MDYRPDGDIGAIFIPFLGHRHVSRFSDGARWLRKDSWNDVEVRMEGEAARIGSLIAAEVQTTRCNPGSGEALVESEVRQLVALRAMRPNNNQ